MAENGGGEEKCSSPVTSSSLEKRVKFLCSDGGKILPRPIDGELRYTGGETRLVVVPRDINFSELMNKLSSLFGGKKVLKYQLMSEDLDALVSVTNDNDVRHMFDEYDRRARLIENGGIPMLRAFLFSSDPEIVPVPCTVKSCGVEQRYIDAINGIVHIQSPTCGVSRRPIVRDIYTTESKHRDLCSPPGLRRGMHRVQSSPSDLYNLGHHQQNHHLKQHRNHHLNHYQCHHQNHYQDHHCPGNVGRARQRVLSSSFGRTENGRMQMSHVPIMQYHSPRRDPNNGGYSGCGHSGDCTLFRSN